MACGAIAVKTTSGGYMVGMGKNRNGVNNFDVECAAGRGIRRKAFFRLD